MEQRGVSVPERLDVVGEDVSAVGTCPDWFPEPRQLAWASANMDRETLFGNFLKLVNKPLNLVRGWLRA